MYTAKQVSNWFLGYNERQKDLGADGISNLKMQKLLYYSQGAVMAILDEKLFEDPILAWKHGPVVESEYRRFRKFGSSEIALPDEEINYPLLRIDDETENVLVEVYNTFGQFSAWGLRDLTHSESPWINTAPCDVINPEEIKEYFLSHYIAEEN